MEAAAEPRRGRPRSHPPPGRHFVPRRLPAGSGAPRPQVPAAPALGSPQPAATFLLCHNAKRRSQFTAGRYKAARKVTVPAPTAAPLTLLPAQPGGAGHAPGGGRRLRGPQGRAVPPPFPAPLCPGVRKRRPLRARGSPAAPGVTGCAPRAPLRRPGQVGGAAALREGEGPATAVGPGRARRRLGRSAPSRAAPVWVGAEAAGWKTGGLVLAQGEKRLWQEEGTGREPLAAFKTLPAD